MKKDKKFEERLVEIRMSTTEPNSRMVEGYAAVFNKESHDLGGFIEIIEPGAFTNAIATSDARALWNHGVSAVLARTKSGTLTLAQDEVGLYYSFESPNTTAGNDLLVMLRRKDVDTSSFGFTVKRDRWEEKNSQIYRYIEEVDKLFDVSPVTFEAYPDTSVAVRSMKAQFEQNTTQTETVDFEQEVRIKIVKAAIEKHS